MESSRVTYVAPDSPRAREGNRGRSQVVAADSRRRHRTRFQRRPQLTYANVTFAPSAADAKQRRMLIERTVALRNELP